MEQDHTQSTSKHNKPLKTLETKHSIKKEYKENIKKYSKMIKQSYKDKLIIDDAHQKHVENRVFSNGEPLLKWLIIVLNVIIELTQVVLAQEASQGLINKANYAKLCVVASLICVTMSIFDVVYEAKEGGVRLRRRGVWVWLYYPGKKGKKFGNFWLGFELISSFVQFFINLGGYVSKKPGFVRFDYLPLLLAFCFLIASFCNGKKLMLGVVNCGEKHGEFEIEGRFVHGSWVFDCPTCKMDVLV